MSVDAKLVLLGGFGVFFISAPLNTFNEVNMIDESFVQEVKRYLHQAEVNMDDTVNVCLSDIDDRDPCKVLTYLFVLEHNKYLKIIGTRQEKGCKVNEDPFDINIFIKEKYPPYIVVVLAEDFGKIDAKFELTYTENSGEVWINNIMLIKQFHPFYGKGRYQAVFEQAYNNAGKLLYINQFEVFNELKVFRLDTAITMALDTLTPDVLDGYFPVLKSKQLRFESVFYEDKGKTDFLVKQPQRYELDPFQKGEWSDGCRRRSYQIYCMHETH